MVTYVYMVATVDESRPDQHEWLERLKVVVDLAPLRARAALKMSENPRRVFKAREVDYADLVAYLAEVEQPQYHKAVDARRMWSHIVRIYACRYNCERPDEAEAAAQKLPLLKLKDLTPTDLRRSRLHTKSRTLIMDFINWLS